MEIKEITAVLLTALKKIDCWHAFKYLPISFIQTWYDDRYNCNLHFDTNLIDLHLDLRSWECAKTKTLAPIISQGSIHFNRIWHTPETYWSNGPRTHFISAIHYSRERTQLT